MDTDYFSNHGWTRIILVTTDGHGWEFQLVKQVSPVETTKGRGGPGRSLLQGNGIRDLPIKAYE
jgi:hypothetical protein